MGELLADGTTRGEFERRPASGPFRVRRSGESVEYRDRVGGEVSLGGERGVVPATTRIDENRVGSMVFHPEPDRLGGRAAADAHDGPVVMYTGDLALLHDLGALYSAVRTGLQLTVVCVDNDGGGIFSMLPIASRGDEVDFETLFRTRHGLDLAALGGTGGVTVTEVATAAALQEAIVSSTQVDAGADVSTQVDGSLDLLLVRVDRDADIAQRRAVTDAVRAAVT